MKQLSQVEKNYTRIAATLKPRIKVYNTKKTKSSCDNLADNNNKKKYPSVAKSWSTFPDISLLIILKISDSKEPHDVLKHFSTFPSYITKQKTAEWKQNASRKNTIDMSFNHHLSRSDRALPKCGNSTYKTVIFPEKRKKKQVMASRVSSFLNSSLATEKF